MGVMSSTVVGFGTAIAVALLVAMSFTMAYLIGIRPIVYFGAVLALVTTALIGVLLYHLGECVLE